MDTGRTRRKPWKSWDDFTGWAQDFSLMQKVLGGFLGVVVLVGLATSFIGTLAASDTIMDRARARLFSDLATAGFVLKNSQEALELKVRFTSSSEQVVAALTKGSSDALRNSLAMRALENDMDFLSVTDEKGRVLARAFDPKGKTAQDVSKDGLVASALNGKGAVGLRLASIERLVLENPALLHRVGKSPENAGLVMEAAYPVHVDSKVVGVIYGGIVLNGNELIVERISHQLFRGEKYNGVPVGYVAVYQGSKAVATTLKGADGLPLTGFEANSKVRNVVLKKGTPEITWDTQNNVQYLAATEGLRDNEGNIVGAIQVATQEQPVSSVIHKLVGTFLVIGLFGVILMGGITYFIVTWINRPLEQMLNSARRAAEGDLSHEVPVVARDEVGELAASFNLMIRNLSESRNKLEEWGKQLASKVAEQTGQLDQAREQVERVKKLASLEKMADGMAHIMAHISDPMLGLHGTDAEGGSTVRVLVLDTEENVLEVCQRILDDEGFEVKLARSTQEAFAELEADFFDVVVADIDVPDMDGKELLQEIKYRQPEVQVILTAPFKATEEAVEAVKMGAYDYIPKPFGPHQILLMVYTALQASKMLDKTRREHAQQRAEKIFQRLPVAIALADKAHRVVYHNRAFIELASADSGEPVTGKSFEELLGVDPLVTKDESGGSRWMRLDKVGRTAKLYNFKLPEEDLRVLMLLDVTETVMKDRQADVFKAETINKAHQVIHQQMRVAQEIAGLLGETTAETKAALFELIKLAGEGGESR